MSDLSPLARGMFNEAFAYARGNKDDTPVEAAPLVVFGRNDARVATKVGELVRASLAEVIVITGGVGKDTGDLLERGYDSEAAYLEEELVRYALEHDLQLPPVLLDKEARNGGENARNSLQLLAERGYLTPDNRTLTAVAHATSARRLAATLEQETRRRDDCSGLARVAIAPTDYDFDPNLMLDRHEVAGEILRMNDFPRTGFGVPQMDIPHELVVLAQEYLQA